MSKARRPRVRRALGVALLWLLQIGVGWTQVLPCTVPAADAEIPNCAQRAADGRLQIGLEGLRVLRLGRHALGAVVVEGAWFHVRRDGKTAAALAVDNDTDALVEGLTRIQRNGKVGFVDRTLREVIAPRWDFAWPFEGGVAVVCTGCQAVPHGEHRALEGGLWGYVDRQGRVVVPVSFTRATLPSVEEARRRSARRKG